ncbi:MAG: L-serine ammonia-lyase [Bifidobacteriaceae bacterium]|jgi:L-serine dehydratase|nr:L-serine ammonia-lyase [Bifidobacteriaceae bacterium]
MSSEIKMTQKSIYNCVFDTFSIGLGPSSSHSVGPMLAAVDFSEKVKRKINFEKNIANIYWNVILYGSLAATSDGHGSVNAVLAGLDGLTPEIADPKIVSTMYEKCSNKVNIILETKKKLDVHHPNAIRLQAFSDKAKQLEILSIDYFSTGGGAVKYKENGQLLDLHSGIISNDEYPFMTMSEVVSICQKNKIALYELAKKYELTHHTPRQLEERVKTIWQIMKNSIEGGLNQKGVLPGWLNVPRRANSIFTKLTSDAQAGKNIGNQKLMAYAIAVAEQNASGQRVVTAPTNGAAGVIPAVLYMWAKEQMAKDVLQADIEFGIGRFILTANIVCSVIKKYASLAGAEVGCQGEIGSASSMAAAGLTELYGGTAHQIENAAEIALEHHLGLTCDPIGGFVQIPCIERNAISARTAVSAAQLAMCSQGSHIVSLDKTIVTMNQTGKDMNKKYKETAEGGLAKNFVEC